MFGHDKQQDNEDNSVPVSIIPTMPSDIAASSAPADPATELSLPSPVSDDAVADAPAADTTIVDSPTADAPAPEPESTPELESTPEYIATPEVPSPTPDAELSGTSIGISSAGDLSSLSALKQDALHALSPLIGQLDQTPEEKYATAKMVYEETKDHNILNAIYEAAKNLPDEKAKAEAIYDVIQKINAAN